MDFSKTLTAWYLENRRDLPWRNTLDPYRIWLSEIVLQQTRVEQGKPYYFKFLNTYPDIFSLAGASEEDVLKDWQGLGYYSRARNLHHTARHIAFGLGGVFPGNFAELKKLRGVGDYTAAAIASICFNEPIAAVDGNVFRMLSRIFGITTPTNSTEGLKEFKKLAQDLIDREKPATFNQAAIEFGSLQCRPRNPICSTCPFSSKCIAFQQGKIKELPVKLKKLKIRERHFNYLVMLSPEKKTMIRKRTKGIWQGMFEFPLIETSTEASLKDLIHAEEMTQYGVSKSISIELHNEKPVVHKLTHQHLYTKFWIIRCKDLPQEGVGPEKLNTFPVPVLIAKFIEEFHF